MPAAARSETTTNTAADKRPASSDRSAAEEATTGAGRAADKTAATTENATSEAANDAAAAGTGAASSVRQIITMPATVARQVADDVVTTVRRPDAVLYLGGLVGLAVVGALEWPVVAAAGIGVAVASGVRRVRA